MRSVYCALLMLIGLTVVGQHEIDFRPLSIEKLKQEARTEKKMIFIDCYTSWCGPCKWMEKNVFTLQSVSAFYNANFVNAKFDMEQGEGRILAGQYGVGSFPTYLFLNESGDVIHRSGSRMEAEDFIREGKIAVSPELSLSGMKTRYEAGERTPSLLYQYSISLQKTDGRMSQQVANELLNMLSDEDLETALGWRVINSYARSEDDRLGKYFMAHIPAFEEIAGKEEATKFYNRLKTIKLNSFINRKDKDAFFAGLPYFKQHLDAGLRTRGVEMELCWYLQQNDVENYVRCSDALLKEGNIRDAMMLMRLAKSAHGTRNVGKAILLQGVKMAKMSVALEPDTYSCYSILAEIYLALGNKQEGLPAAQSAVKLAEKESSKALKHAQKIHDELNKL